ncbi:MAG: hypothetical protein CVU64_21090 [Deltaproteobacteria bacterium HGW-Deltaproteobacteria-21]|nr:MAG: hypothetical protein CVU64_21090 [Deltaproteobacteria bacterium HGW-Deltaproteobacteria-21]
MEKSAREMTFVEGKSGVFSILGRALSYPDKTLADDLTGGGLGNGLAAAFTPFSSNGILHQLTGLKNLYEKEPPESVLLQLEKDYTWMCFASKPRLVYLFESIYREGRLFQESTFQIARLYREAGLEWVGEFQLPPDHIAMELEFMAYLCFCEAEAVRLGDLEKEEYARKLQTEVLEKHLRPFGLAFSQRMEMHAGTDFYRLIARVLGSMLKN